MQEREIDLIDLLAEILLHWRRIIVGMTVGAVVFGVVSYGYSVRSAAEQKAIVEQQVLEQQVDVQAELNRLEETLTSVEKYGVNAVINNEKLDEYYNQSLLMQINAANVPKMELIFKVTAEDYEESCSIEKIYEDILSCGLLESIGSEEEVSASQAQLSELITLNSGLNIMPNSIVTVIRNEEIARESFLQVTIIHITEEECRKLSDQILNYLEEQHTQLKKTIGEHEFELIDKSFAYVTDTKLLDQQRLMLTNIMNSNTNAEKLKKDFSDLQARYYTLLKELSVEGTTKDVEELEEETVISNPTASIKHIILGMVIFAVLYIVYIILKYVLNTKLRGNDNINQIYNIPLLGSISQEQTPQELFKCVDEWILKLRNHGKKVFSNEEAIGLTAVALKMQMKKEGVDTAYCVGCNMKQSSMQVVEQLQNILIKENITIIVLNDILYNQDTMEQLQDAKAVFLMEKVGETLYDEIAKEQELLKRQNIKVLGAVIVE